MRYYNKKKRKRQTGSSSLFVYRCNFFIFALVDASLIGRFFSFFPSPIFRAI